MERLKELANPQHVKKFQGLCGVVVKEKNAGSVRNGMTGEGALTRRIYNSHQQEVRRLKIQYDDKCENNNNILEKNRDASNPVHTHWFSSHSIWDYMPSSIPDTVEDNGIEYEIRYKSLFWLSKFAGFLGEEQFFLAFFTYVLWNLDSVIGRQTIMVWFVSLYLGQATKDFLQLPRPSSPPVVRLEGKHLEESAMPSTHAMAGTSMPIVLTILTCTRYQCSWLLVGTVGVLWCALVCLSRLYLGVHTILDILCGFFFSVLVCIVMVPYLPNIDYYQQHHPFAPLVILIASISLCTICYPTTEKHAAKAKAVEIVSVTAGICIGLWINCQMGFVTGPHEPIPYKIAYPTLKWFSMTLCRFLCGSAVSGFFYVVVKMISVRFFSLYFGLEKVDEKHPSVRMAHKFVTYLVLGFMTTCGAPMIVFKALGIERISAFYEGY